VRDQRNGQGSRHWRLGQGSTIAAMPHNAVQLGEAGDRHLGCFEMTLQSFEEHERLLREEVATEMTLAPPEG
jgi:hypothetical protein